MFRQARAGDLELITSVLSQTEVAYAASEKESGELEPGVEARIDELWKPDAPLKVVELHSAIAVEARTLMRAAVAAGRSGLKPADAIHLATAARMHAEVFFTYDLDLPKHAPDVDFSIGEPATTQTQLPGM